MGKRAYRKRCSDPRPWIESDPNPRARNSLEDLKLKRELMKMVSEGPLGSALPHMTPERAEKMIENFMSAAEDEWTDDE